MTKARIGILSLGCPRNLVDSESIAGRLASKGFSIVDVNDADIAIVNTCAFVNDAKAESIDAILDLIAAKKRGRIRKIIVYGCFSQRYKGVLAEQLPEVDAFVGRTNPENSSKRFGLTPPHYAYLKICEGCINQCSFCIIPGIKGRFQSVSLQAVLRKCRQLDADRISELNIIGQDITAYGRDTAGNIGLAGLLARVLKAAPHIGWFRLLYLYPSRVDLELLRLIRDERRVCEYLDIPVQHTSDRILKAMNRATKRKDIVRLIERIRRIVPSAAIRTTLITGFPGETDKEFKSMLGFIKDFRFERLGIFMYSREEGTKAYGFPKQIPAAVKRARFNALMLAQQEVSRDINSKCLGKEMEVLIDSPEGKGIYLGRSRHDAPEVDGNVFVKSSRALIPGEFVNVRIVDTMEYDLVGESLR